MIPAEYRKKQKAKLENRKIRPHQLDIAFKRVYNNNAHLNVERTIK